MGFMPDVLTDGWAIRVFIVVDVCSREGLAGAAGLLMPTMQVIRIQERIVSERGRPLVLDATMGPNTTTSGSGSGARGRVSSCALHSKPGKPA